MSALAHAPSWWPLIAVLAVQAGLSLRLVRAYTAFQDEAAYLWAGHLEWAYWLHGAPVPRFSSYFSGSPAIYAPIAAIADAVGNLIAARILSLVFMLGATALLWGATDRLYGHRADRLLVAGGAVRDLVGIDGYYYRPSDTFASVFGRTIAAVRAITSKPVLLSETAVGPGAGQAAKIGDLFASMRLYQTLGLVWFDIAQHHGVYHQDWRIDNSPAAEAAFRLHASALPLARL